MLAQIQRRLFTTKKLTGSSKSWMDRHMNDQYVKQAKLQSYRSRAAFKLQEMDQKYILFKKGMKVIDVGASPGGWSQIIAEKVMSEQGSESVVACDLLEMVPIKGVKFVQGDIEKDEVQEKVSEMLDFQKADVVCSDAVPDFVGERFIDHMRSIQLNNMVVDFCGKNLKKGGTLLMKIIQGPGEQELFNFVKLHFDSLMRVKPSASRQESKEMYFLARGYEESKEQIVLDFNKEKQKIDSFKNEQDREEYLESLVKESKGMLQSMVNEMLKRGMESNEQFQIYSFVVPEEMRRAIKDSEAYKDIDIEQKMNLRERQKAKKRAEEQEEKYFEEKVGIKDESKNFSYDKLHKKYERDMRHYEKKLQRMNQLDKEGIEYDEGEIQVTDSESENETKPKSLQYDDEPYRAKEEEDDHLENEYDRIKQKLQDLEGQVPDGEEISQDDQAYHEYTKILNNIDEFADSGFRQEEQQQFEEDLKGEQKEMERLYKDQQKVSDEYFDRRAVKTEKKRTGGLRPQSPVWNDDD